MHRHRMDIFKPVVDMKKAFPAHQHGPAWCRYRPMMTSHHITARKTNSTAGEQVNVWGPDVSISISSDGIGPLVVGKKKENIWFLGLGAQG